MYDFRHHYFKPSGLVLVGTNKNKLLVQAQDSGLGLSLIRGKLYEPYETWLFKRTVRSGMVVVDAGANVGYYTLLASSLVGRDGRVYSFEPDPYNCALLKRNVRINQCTNVIIEQKALIDRYRSVNLFKSVRNFGEHRVYDMHDKRKKTNSIGTSLDDYFRDKPSKVDVMKMDIEGAEAMAFEGMNSLIETNDDLQVFLEILPTGEEASGFSSKAFLERLFKFGFQIYLIDVDKNELRRQKTAVQILSLCSHSANLFLSKGSVRSD
jgi:FkbM family methyltransferase